MTIHFTTTRDIEAGEELSIFYSHDLWFDDLTQVTRPGNPRNSSLRRAKVPREEEGADDLLGALSRIAVNEDSMDEVVGEADLPFEEIKYLAQDEEEDSDEIPTSTHSFVAESLD